MDEIMEILIKFVRIPFIVIINLIMILIYILSLGQIGYNMEVD